MPCQVGSGDKIYENSIPEIMVSSFSEKCCEIILEASYTRHSFLIESLRSHNADEDDNV